jgi:hypothetical protein
MAVCGELAMKAKAWIAAALALCACAAPTDPAPAGPPAPSNPYVDMRLRLDAGERWRVVYERDVAISENGALSRAQSRQTYLVEAIDPARWIWLQEEGPGAGWVGDLGAFTCAVDSHGACLAIEDWDDVRRRLYITAASQVSERGANYQAGLERMLGPMSAEAAGAFALEGVSILGRVQGLRLRLGDVVRFDAATPNPLGGAPTPMTGQIRLVGVNMAARTADIAYRLEMDDAVGGTAVRTAMLGAMVNQPGANPLTMEEAAAMVDGLLGRIDSRWLEDGQATIDLNTGRVLVAESTISGRLRATGGMQELDTTMSGTVTLRQEAIPEGS